MEVGSLYGNGYKPLRLRFEGIVTLELVGRGEGLSCGRDLFRQEDTGGLVASGGQGAVLAQMRCSPSITEGRQ